MEEEIRLNDIADELLILNKVTIDKLFQLDNCVDCIALYVFYYKTAKWQKTNTIKANDSYIKKSLKWGADKIRKTKQTLKENGLINVIQRRENGKIQGWYVEVSYLVAQRKTEDIKVKVEESKNTQKQEHLKPTSGFEDTNALKEKIKCLEKEIKMLKENKGGNNVTKKLPNTNEYFKNQELNSLFIEFLEVRKKLKAVNSERAINTLLKTLSEYDDNTKCKMIETSIVNSWKSVYPLKKDKPNASNTYKRQEVVPDWLNKDIKDTTTPEEQKELEDLLAEYKDPEFEERKTKLQARLKEKYKKQRA